MTDECSSCHTPFQQHLGLEGTCQQLQNTIQKCDNLTDQRDFAISEIERLEKVNLELIKDLEFRRELYEVLQTRSDGIEQERDEARDDAAHWKSEYEIVVARLCGVRHERDNGIIFGDEIIPKLKSERDEAREECLEQARLLGKGGQREASLLSQVEELKTKLKQYNT
jgi:uncharacterized coiled-coil DUF342 family protein